MRSKFGLFLLVMLSGCSAQSPLFSKSEPLHAVGYAPISLQSPSNYQQKLLHAMRASKMDAYRELTEQLGGVMSSSSSTMNSHVLQDGTVSNSSRGVVRGAQVVNSYPDGDMYITELKLDLNRYEKLRRGE
ncbi:LPP20 family lipoprotein [Oceanisphaera pacifica]|uniref:LPP20 family lipoprotein n=1 Tax=Oceanisphaera pacifica TaxID=2818389 RepID=A0ABS3NHB3_9GAMM|nr:LPP20 family lipoprotein [Oceanisphaera pacifica]MBO1519974.1 LPP20 family lipoprotein [Oceanisphaera pacifica]